MIRSKLEYIYKVLCEWEQHVLDPIGNRKPDIDTIRRCQTEIEKIHIELDNSKKKLDEALNLNCFF